MKLIIFNADITIYQQGLLVIKYLVALFADPLFHRPVIIECSILFFCIPTIRICIKINTIFDLDTEIFTTNVTYTFWKKFHT